MARDAGQTPPGTGGWPGTGWTHYCACMFGPSGAMYDECLGGFMASPPWTAARKIGLDKLYSEKAGNIAAGVTAQVQAEADKLLGGSAPTATSSRPRVERIRALAMQNVGLELGTRGISSLRRVDYAPPSTGPMSGTTKLLGVAAGGFLLWKLFGR